MLSLQPVLLRDHFSNFPRLLIVTILRYTDQSFYCFGSMSSLWVSSVFTSWLYEVCEFWRGRYRDITFHHVIFRLQSIQHDVSGEDQLDYLEFFCEEEFSPPHLFNNLEYLFFTLCITMLFILLLILFQFWTTESSFSWALVSP